MVVKNNSDFLFRIRFNTQKCQLFCFAHQHIHALRNLLRNLLAFRITLHRCHRTAMNNSVKLRQAHTIRYLYRAHTVKVFIPFLIRAIQGIGLQHRDIKLRQIIQGTSANAEQGKFYSVDENIGIAFAFCANVLA